MTVDAQSRKFQLTINNPKDKGYTHEKIKEILSEFKTLVYWCMADEIGLKEKTYHTHLFICSGSAMRVSTIQNRFPSIHYEICRGTCKANREYVFKEGKWKLDDKEETQVEGTQEEFGEMPVERQGQRNDLSDLYDFIHSGMSDYEILSLNQNYMLQIEKIQKVRRVLLSEKYKRTFREMDVTYLHGETGSGKTRSVMEKYGFDKVFRVTDYKHPFDAYEGQDIIIFEEFRGQLTCTDMLNYLDGYPLELPCRYENKVACYTKGYILSNIPLEEQYKKVQEESIETYKAFLRRIHREIEKNKDREYQIEMLSDIPF